MHWSARTRRSAGIVLGLCLASLLPSAGALAATGTDLGFGYTWRDSADGALQVLAGFDTVTRMTPGDNTPPLGPIPLPFVGGFPFYGSTYTQCWISDNGWVSFTDPGVNPFQTPSGIPLPAGPVAMVTTLWNDLQVAPAGRISYGPNAALGIYRIQYSGIDPTTGGTAVLNDLLLFADGHIQFQYGGTPVFGNGTTGIENAAGTDGIALAAGGVVNPAINAVAGYVVDFYPPALLPPTCAGIPGGACRTINGTTPAAGTNVQFYSCGGNRFAAQEAVYSFTISQASNVTLNLTTATGLTLHLLSACNEYSCFAGPATTLTGLLGSGTYYVTVDGATAANEGMFTLDIACTALGSPLACGATVSGTTVGGPSNFSIYPCGAPRLHGGQEAYYSIQVAAPTNVAINLDFAGADVDLLVLRAQPGIVTVADCVAYGDNRAVIWNALPGEYLLVVDAEAGITANFDITTSCGIDLDCTPPRGVLDLGVSRAQRITGDTIGGTNTVTGYSCDPGTVLDGPDEVWEVILRQPGYLAVSQNVGFDGLVFPILTDCNEGSCISMGRKGQNCAGPLPPGTYYITVDSQAPNAGPYEATVFFEEVFNRWDVCEDPSGATMRGEMPSPFWNFDDLAYCHTDPTSRNFPGGCTFAMYVTVACGTAMHLPFFDVEGGHVRVFDVFNGQYVTLTAISGGGWFQQGTDIDWSLQDCDGNDPRWNEVVTDVFFDRPAGLCGIFRIEFPNFSGFVWELYANCAGDRTPQFNIHDSLCTALGEYTPLPNVTIVSATANATCPDVTVDFVVRNDGCAGLTDFPITLYDDATPVYVHLIPVLPANSTVTGSFMATYPMVPTGTVTLQVDALNGVGECTETPGAACSAVTGLESVQLAGCAIDCLILAQASATPTRICAGDASEISGAASSSSQCTGGILEYQLRDAGGVIVPWQLSPTFPGISPTAQHSYTVDVRCADPALADTCLSSRNVTIDVDVPPLFDAASVVGFDIAACNPGIRLTWSAATFYGVLGTGAYNVYRSTVSRADALTQPPLAIGLTALTFADVTAPPETPVYYVVEAEDETTGGACLPRGPRNGGAVTQVDVSGGICVAVTDSVTPRTDLLPIVGATLRLGGTYPGGGARYAEFFVELEWGSDRPLSLPADEHFHVLRSNLPDTGWVLYSMEPPRVQTPYFLDLSADDGTGNTANPHVWFYLVYSADACENDNRLFDP